MRRIYEAAAYLPQTGCYWAGTVPEPDWPVLMGDIRCDVAVIGGGFTGLSTALHLAQGGLDVRVFEAETPGFGASGRNGGFCCLGGAKASDTRLRRDFGADGLAEWRQTELAAVQTVADLITQFDMQVDRHSEGETLLAHSPRAMTKLRARLDQIHTDYGVPPILTEAADLPAAGLGGPFHGAVTIPIGFAMNPRKFHSALAEAAISAGVFCHARTAVRGIGGGGGTWRLRTRHGTITADRVVIATNGYSSEDVPRWLRGRYLPVQSSVLVTRPLSADERQAQGWTSMQMAYDTRNLLHYFRLMPDGRFLFGMRGGLRATPRANGAIKVKHRADFHAMFPAWAGVDVTHDWQGLVCLMPGFTPFCGPIPGMRGVYAGLGYHGNGVAMGTHTGILLADQVMGRPPRVAYPTVMRRVPRRLPFGRFRRGLLWPAYAAAQIIDRH